MTKQQTTPPTPILIDTQDALDAFCEGLNGADFITVDTEFLRERTYYPKLCLIQIAGPASEACIDPLVGLDLEPVYKLLRDESLLKVFHAGRQDLEIFYNGMGDLPKPVADTQVMAMVCGFGDSVSYETLASRLAKAKIDKSSRFTDWSHRPLTEKQLTYALADVTHLRDIFVKLQLQLHSQGRTPWIQEEMRALTDLSIYEVDPDQVWLRLKFRTDKPRVNARLQKLAAWREREAQRLDIPRGRVIRDEALQEIAHSNPAGVSELARTRGLSQSIADGRMGTAILELLREVEVMAEKDLPPGLPKKPPNAEGTSAIVDLLRTLLKGVAGQADVAAKLIASSDDLDQLAISDNPDIKPLSGWRYEIFGKPALALKQGKLAITLDRNKIVFIEPMMGDEVTTVPRANEA